MDRGSPPKTKTASPAQDAREATSTASAHKADKVTADYIDALTEALRGQSCDVATYLYGGNLKWK